MSALAEDPDLATDLHGHSRFSDARVTPEEYVAARAALRLIALSDHDVMAGVRRAAAATQALGGPLLIAGVWMWFGTPKFETKVMADRGFTDEGHAAFAMLMAMGAWVLACAGWHRVRNGVVGLLWALGGAPADAPATVASAPFAFVPFSIAFGFSLRLETWNAMSHR